MVDRVDIEGLPNTLEYWGDYGIEGSSSLIPFIWLYTHLPTRPINTTIPITSIPVILNHHPVSNTSISIIGSIIIYHSLTVIIMGTNEIPI